MSIVGAGGNFEKIDIALAIVNKETSSNYQFLFECAANAGLNWNKYILFLDRGHNRSGANHASTISGININLKYY